MPSSSASSPYSSAARLEATAAVFLQTDQDLFTSVLGCGQ